MSEYTNGITEGRLMTADQVEVLENQVGELRGLLADAESEKSELIAKGETWAADLKRRDAETYRAHWDIVKTLKITIADLRGQLTEASNENTRLSNRLHVSENSDPAKAARFLIQETEADNAKYREVFEWLHKEIASARHDSDLGNWADFLLKQMNHRLIREREAGPVIVHRPNQPCDCWACETEEVDS